ncbi:hypothetical protein E2C01_042102 [Portunus trituberculatus]|uniref:Uncharacterized protein n=1 Tax=Portunus trituberculatus TaxID=210409 RepID=A0A5B7FVJ0_PORTR|nr:hypothetical protein [Portunus trituberculatus]
MKVFKWINVPYINSHARLPDQEFSTPAVAKSVSSMSDELRYYLVGSFTISKERKKPFRIPVVGLKF